MTSAVSAGANPSDYAGSESSIPPEAVEAACKTFWNQQVGEPFGVWNEQETRVQNEWRTNMRAALEAAYPALVARCTELEEKVRLLEAADPDERASVTYFGAYMDQKRKVEALRADAALGKAIQRAAGELPDGWQIVLEVELGSGGFTLYDAEGAGQEDDHYGDPADCTLAERLNAAIDAARAGGQEDGHGK